MKDKTLMKLMIETPNFIREKLLTDSEIQVFNTVKNTCHAGGIGSESLSIALGISIQSASGRLKNLYRKKYLKRKGVTAITGGLQYVYTVAI